MHRLTLKDYDQYLKEWDETEEYPLLLTRKQLRRKYGKNYVATHSSFTYLEEVGKTFYLDPKTIVLCFVDFQSTMEPHFHLIGWDNFHTVISLDKPEYVYHGFQYDVLTEPQLRNLLSYLGTVHPCLTETFITSIKTRWNDGYGNWFKSDPYHLPDYSKLERI